MAKDTRKSIVSVQSTSHMELADLITQKLGEFTKKTPPSPNSAPLEQNPPPFLKKKKKKKNPCAQKFGHDTPEPSKGIGVGKCFFHFRQGVLIGQRCWWSHSDWTLIERYGIGGIEGWKNWDLRKLTSTEATVCGLMVNLGPFICCRLLITAQPTAFWEVSHE